MLLEYDEKQSLTIIDDINKHVGYYFYTKPYYWSSEEENRVVELFLQRKETPEVYSGEKIKKKIHLATYIKRPKAMYKEQERLLENYLHNVGGEIIQIKAKTYTRESDITIYYEVPKNAPYSKKVEEQMEKLIHQFDTITQRVILRTKYNKKLPEIRDEEYYLNEQDADIFKVNYVSFCVAFIGTLLMVVCYTLIK